MKNFFVLAAMDPDTLKLVKVAVICVVGTLVLIGLGMWFYRSWHRYSPKKDPVAGDPEIPIPINPVPAEKPVVDAEVIPDNIIGRVRIHWREAPSLRLFPCQKASAVHEVLAKALSISEIWTSHMSSHSSWVLMEDGSLDLQVHLPLDSLSPLPVYDLQIVPDRETIATLIAIYTLEHGTEKSLRSALHTLRIPEDSKRISVLRLTKKGRPRVKDSFVFERMRFKARVYLSSVAGRPVRTCTS